MQKVNNKHGIKMFWELDGTDTKVIILDSNGKYFEDLYYDDSQELNSILHDLEQSTIEELCNFVGARIFTSKKELCKEEELTSDDIKDNCYLNEFKVNNKKYYTFIW